jgi:probable HAF family extracellular repeat protein
MEGHLLHIAVMIFTCMLSALVTTTGFASLTKVSDPSELTSSLIQMEFASPNTTGLLWGPPGQAYSTDSAFYYNGPLPSPNRYLRCTGPLTLTFPAPTTQVGMWFGRDDPGLSGVFDITLEAFGSSGSLGTVSETANMNYDVDQFVGFISTEEVESVVVTYGFVDYVVVVDDVYWAEPVRPPPPPDPDPNDAFAAVFLSDTRLVSGSLTVCETGGGCTTDSDSAAPVAPFADFSRSTPGFGIQISGFSATGFQGYGGGEAGGSGGAGFSQSWWSTSDLEVQFEVTTPSTLTLSATASFASQVTLVEDSFLLFEITGSGTPVLHSDVLHPGMTYTLSASAGDGIWDFDLALQESVAAIFTPLGDLPGGPNYSFAHAVSADGTWVVGCSQATEGLEAFRWSAGTGLQSLGEAPGGAHSSCARDVSNDGSVVVGTTETASGPSAFRWTEANGLELIAHPGTATGVSDDGQIIVGATPYAGTSGTDYGWYTDPGSITSTTTVADPIRAIAGDASVIGLEKCYPTFPYECEAILSSWNGSSYVGYLVWGSDATVVDLSADGSYAVLRDLFDTQLRDPSGTLRRLPNSAGEVFGYPEFYGGSVAAHGKAVAGYGENNVAFLWTESAGTLTAQSILTAGGADLTGWTLTQLRGISDDGEIVVGIGTNPSGDVEAFVANLPAPSPAEVPVAGSVWPLIIALVGAGSLVFYRGGRAESPRDGGGSSGSARRRTPAITG